MQRQAGLIVALIGAVLVVVGLLWAAGALGWFGRLPGDIRIQRDGFSLYLPITSMVLVSLILTLLLTVLRRVL